MDNAIGKKQNRIKKFFIAVWKSLPRCWSYVSISGVLYETEVLYIWAFRRKWDVAKIRIV